MLIDSLRSNSLLRKKDVGVIIANSFDPHVKNHLDRSVGIFSLTMLGVGNVVGTGIFFVLAITVPRAGPAVLLSFALVAVITGLTALCYAEVASTLPIAGSAYSYAMATIGEFPAYIVGWCLILEYGVGGSAIAVGWADYLNELLFDVFHWRIPEMLNHGPFDDGTRGIVNAPAVLLVVLCSALLLRGVRESTRITTVLVLVKLATLAVFVVVAFKAFDPSHFQPFVPNGFSGITAAVPAIFFTYVGLDVLAVAGEEAEKPARAIPRATGYALLIITAVYVLVTIAALGAQEWTKFDGQSAGLAKILLDVSASKVPAIIISVGAVISVFSVAFISLYGQSRIMFAIARDGLLPPQFCKVNPRTLSPNISVIVSGLVAAALAAVLPMARLWDLISIGILLAFIVVSLAVIYIRRNMPELTRGFSVPFYPWLPLGSAAACVWAMTTIPEVTWLWVGAWAAIAVVMYFGYSRKHSVLNANSEAKRP